MRSDLGGGAWKYRRRGTGWQVAPVEAGGCVVPEELGARGEGGGGTRPLCKGPQDVLAWDSQKHWVTQTRHRDLPSGGAQGGP